MPAFAGHKNHKNHKNYSNYSTTTHKILSLFRIINHFPVIRLIFCTMSINTIEIQASQVNADTVQKHLRKITNVNNLNINHNCEGVSLGFLFLHNGILTTECNTCFYDIANTEINQYHISFL